MRSTLLLALGFLAPAAAGCRTTLAVPEAPLAISFESRSWDSGESAGRELITPHYSIYTTSTSPEILSHLPGFLEAAHANYLDLTGLADQPGGQRMPVYMMATHQEWAALTRSVVGPQWELYSNIQAGGYCYRGVCVFWDIGGFSALSVASHEGLHQFLHHRLKDRLPMWLEEGLAAMAEGYQVDTQAVRFDASRNAGRFGDLRKAIVQDWWIPTGRLLAMDGADAVQLGSPERAVGYYGQVWAMGLLLRSDPAFAPRRAKILADAEAGRFHQTLKLSLPQMAALQRRGRAYNRIVSAPLFRHYVAEDVPEFEKRYKAFAKKLARLE